jgi:hypothetical protein
MGDTTNRHLLNRKEADMGYDIEDYNIGDGRRTSKSARMRGITNAQDDHSAKDNRWSWSRKSRNQE